MKRFLLATLGVALALALASRADADSPFDPNYQDAGPILVDDDVMPSRAEVETTAAWIRRAFGAEKDAAATSDAPLIVVERQDYSRLRFGETCVGDRFVVGGRAFEKGLGTHADSRLRVLCPKPVAKFDATVGLATADGQGSVRYAVEVDGKTIVKSEIARGGDAPREIHASFDPPTKEFTLLVDRADDGPNCDQANWLEPIATTTDGKIFDLATDAVVERIRPETPFSFKLDGVSSREFLNKWRFNAVRESPLVDLFVWSDPETKLEIRARVRRFEKFAAAEWLLEFVNAGENDSPILSEIQALDAAFDYGFEREACVVHSLSGDSCDENSWIPKSTAVPPGGAIEVAPRGGRSSNGAFPFWNVVSRRTGETERAEGFFIAIGWSGQWRATFENLAQAQPTIVAKAGLESISTILHPNESIRSPRILVMPWRGCLESSQVLFRRLLMFEYAPKIDGKPVKLGIVSQCFDRYYRKRAGWETVDSQIEMAKRFHEIGGTTHWFDAAWFPKGFPTGVGNWRSDPTNFPNGVEELGAALKDLGMKFVLWFEPERVAPETDLAQNAAKYVHGGENGGLYKLDDPEAREYLATLLNKRIKDFQIDVYRNDFNLDPLPYWRANDAPNRQGMTESRYVAGHYELWRRLLDANPGLWIDNCASGGRRIDLETISLSVPLWRSDTCCWPGHPEWDQNQTLGLARWLPLFSCCAWSPDPYVFRSAANPGAIMQYNFLDDDYDREAAKASVQEAKVYQKFWYGDFYPLSETTVDKRSIAAWQLHRPDLDAGLVYVFRRPESPYPGLEFELRGIDPDQRYVARVKTGRDVDAEFELLGKDLANYLLMIPAKGVAVVLEYEKK